MQKKWTPTLFIIALIITLGACGTSVEKTDKPRSMEQIYSEEGKPVNVKTIETEPFSVYLTFPAEFRAQNQSTAYSDISDVVREVKVKIGDHVKRDEVILIFSIDNSQYQQAKLRFENLGTEYNRLENLFKEGGVSKQTLDNIQMQYELAREAFKAARETIEIKAPINGYVTQLYVQTSSNVKSGEPLFTISNNEGFEAFFYVSANEINQIESGAPAIIFRGDESIEGRISEVSLIMDAKKKAFPVKGFFSKKPKTLVSGMSIDVSVEIYRNVEAVVINRNELIHSDDGWYAFVADGDTAEKRKITTGMEKGLLLEITEGLRPGEVIVTKGVQELKDGTRIRIIESIATK